MTQLHTFISRRALAAAAAALVFPAGAAAQRSAPQAEAAASPVPLTTRAIQAESVAVVQAPSGATGGMPGSSVQVQGPFTGSTAGRNRRPFSGMLTFGDAIQRGLEFNLGVFNLTQTVRQSRGQRAVTRSALLPSVTADLTETLQKVNLAAFGLKFSAPIDGFTIPTVVGPYTNVDLRARVSQTILDVSAWNNYRASAETVRANEMTVEDTREIVVLAVGGTYIQAVAARARVTSGRTQLDTANALYQQNVQRRSVGLIAQVDVDRSQVQVLTQQQRLIALQNDFAKQKINLARMIGLPPTDQYELVSDVGFTAAPSVSLDEALRQAQAQRADLKAAEGHVRAAERALSAARAERLPSVKVTADYGTIGTTLSDAQGTYAVTGSVRVPLWQGGRAAGQIQQAEAAMAERRAELEDLASQIEGDVRKAYLDVEAAATQVDVAQKSREVSRETLDLTRQRFDAGVSDNVEVVQAQESVANAEFDYINSVFAHNIAKLSLARAMGQAAGNLTQFLKVP